MRRRSDDRGPWYLLTGLVIGVVIGLLYAWLFSPVQYINTAPASMRSDFKAQYRALAAVAYMASGNLNRAQLRLAELKDGDLSSQVAAQAQAWLDGTHPDSEVRALNVLAAAMQQGPTPASGSPTAVTPAPQPNPADSSATPVIILTSSLDNTPTPTAQASLTPGPLSSPPISPTFTPLPSLTPTPTPGGAFVLKKQELICSADLPNPLIQVVALDAAGSPVPGVEVSVRWNGGQDHFFTGLKPELGLGYGDFTMSQGVSYTILVLPNSQPAADIQATECEAPGVGRIWGSWKFTYQQP